MKTIDRIFKKISAQPNKKAMLQAKLKQGFVMSKQDRTNLTIMLNRMGVKHKANTADNTLLRLYLNAQYKEQVKLQKLAKTTKAESARKKNDSQLKLKRLIQILEESEVKPNKTSMGSHYVKLVK